MDEETAILADTVACILGDKITEYSLHTVTTSLIYGYPVKQDRLDQPIESQTCKR